MSDEPDQTPPFYDGPINGWRTDFSDERHVFLGQIPNGLGYAITFSNKGVETNIGVSREAMAALVSMFQDHYEAETGWNGTGTWKLVMRIAEKIKDASK